MPKTMRKSMRVKRPDGENLRPRLVIATYKAKGGPSNGKWVVAWQRPTMSTPSFHYFRTKKEANAYKLRLMR